MWGVAQAAPRFPKLVRSIMSTAFVALRALLLSLLLAAPLLVTWLETGLVPRFPTAVLCAALALMGLLLLACGLILDTVTRGRIEAKHMAYLAVPAPVRAGGDGQ